MEIKGLTYIDDYITAEEEKDFLKYINSQEWNNKLSRRTQHYGYEYIYNKKNKLNEATEIPSIFKKLLNKINKEFGGRFDQLIVNEYKPGQGIAPHIDNIKLFGDKIVSISMGSNTVIEFKYSDTKINKLLKRRSIVVLEDDARYIWSHSIPSRKADDGVDRGTRISLTFRSVNQ